MGGGLVVTCRGLVVAGGLVETCRVLVVAGGLVGTCGGLVVAGGLVGEGPSSMSSSMKNGTVALVSTEMRTNSWEFGSNCVCVCVKEI